MPDNAKDKSEKEEHEESVSKKTAEQQLDNVLDAEAPKEAAENTADNADAQEPVGAGLVDDVEKQLEETIQERKPDMEQVAERQQSSAPGAAKSIADNESELESALDETFEKADARTENEAPTAPKITGAEKNTRAANAVKESIPEEAAAPEPKKENGVIRRLRTYKDDIARALKSQKASITSIASAEQNRRAKQTPPPEPKRASRGKQQTPFKIVAIALAVILVIGGGAFAGYAFFFSGSETGDGVTPPDFLRVNEIKAVRISESDTANAVKAQLAAEKTAASVSLGEVLQLYPTQETESGTTLVHTDAFLESIGAGVPAPLARTFSETFVLGIHAFDGNEPFLIIPIADFQIAFAEMLAWENELNAALAPLFGPDIGRFRVPPGSDAPPERRAFRDRVVGNQDVRVLLNDRGETALLYGFPNPDTLIITTNPNTFSEVLDRLRSTRIIQTNT